MSERRPARPRGPQARWSRAFFEAAGCVGLPSTPLDFLLFFLLSLWPQPPAPKPSFRHAPLFFLALGRPASWRFTIARDRG